MTQFLKEPARATSQMIEGVIRADDRLARIAGTNIVVRRDSTSSGADRVAVISGGGAGHEPAHAGYVGEGMLTAAVAGPVFASPSVDAVLEAILTVANSAGVLLIVKNYTGDRLNFGLAAELARSAGVAVETVLVADDVALDDDGPVGRRGIAGCVFVHKIAGAAAAEGLSLASVKEAAEQAAANTFSMGVAWGLPALERNDSDSSLREGDIEYGLGIHGERGVRRTPFTSADIIIDSLIDRILDQSRIGRSDRIVVMVNNLGGAARLEIDIASRRVLERLWERDVRVEGFMTGSLLTSLNMRGLSLTFMRVDQVTLKRLFAQSDASAWPGLLLPAQGKDSLDLPGVLLTVDECSLTGPAWRTKVDREQFYSIVNACVRAIEKGEDELTRLDTLVGDGDIGRSLLRGARALNAEAAVTAVNHPAVALMRMSSAVRREVGGTSGPLYAVMFLKASQVLASATDPTDGRTWRHAFEAACAGVQALGGARPGDRTMVDALQSAVDALSNLHSSTNGSALARAASDGARRGADATSEMPPRRGRSSYLGDRVLGVKDPGAEAIAILMATIAKACPAIGEGALDV